MKQNKEKKLKFQVPGKKSMIKNNNQNQRKSFQVKTISSPFKAEDVAELLNLVLVHELTEVPFGVNIMNNKPTYGEGNLRLDQLLQQVGKLPKLRYQESQKQFNLSKQENSTKYKYSQDREEKSLKSFQKNKNQIINQNKFDNEMIADEEQQQQILWQKNKKGIHQQKILVKNYFQGGKVRKIDTNCFC